MTSLIPCLLLSGTTFHYDVIDFVFVAKTTDNCHCSHQYVTRTWRCGAQWPDGDAGMIFCFKTQLETYLFKSF